MLPIIDCIAQV